LVDEVDLYPKLENHNMTKKDIEKYLENIIHIKKWIIYDHLPNESDIDQFENIIDQEFDDDEDSNNFEECSSI